MEPVVGGVVVGGNLALSHASCSSVEGDVIAVVLP